jgi:hypothetical protein
VPITESTLAPDDVVFVPKTGIARRHRRGSSSGSTRLTPQIFKSFRTPAL